MSANNNEVKQKARLTIYVETLQSARARQNNAQSLPNAPGRFFPAAHLQTKPEPVMQKPKIEGPKK